MSKQKQFEFAYPPVEQTCLKHRLATRIFKGIIKDEYGKIEKCQCCGRTIGNQFVQNQFFYDDHQLSFLGVGIPLYFSFLKSAILFLIIFSIVFCTFGIYFNLTKDNCKYDPIECKLNLFETLDVSSQNKVNYRNYVSVQNYILLVFVILSTFLFQYLRYKFRTIQQLSDEFNDTPSDYAIIIKRLPLNIQVSDIQQMIQERRGFLSVQQKQATSDLKVQKIILSYDLTEYMKTKRQELASFKKLIKSNQYQNFKAPVLPTPKKTASIAIVVFSHQASKDYFIQRPKFNQRVLQFFFRSLTPLSDYYVKGKRISIQRAPEPDDIIWQNAHITLLQSLIRKTCLGSISFLFLIITGYIQFRLAAHHRKVESQTTKDFLHAFSSIIVHITNIIIKQYMIRSVHWEKLSTKTERMELLTTKICLLQFLNSGIVVVIANIMANGQLFQLDIEFAQKATHIMTMNATVPIITHFCVNYFDIFGKINRFLMHKKLMVFTQLQANKIYQLPNPRIPNQYSYVMKTLWLSAFYAAFSPVVVPISICGLIVYYIIQKRLFHGSYSVPHMMSSIVNDAVFQLFQYFPLILSIGLLYLYIDFLRYQPKLLPDYWVTPVFISIAISIINLVLPMKELNLIVYSKGIDKPHQPLFQQVQKDFQVTYDMTNPVCKSTRKRLSDVSVWKQLFGHSYQHENPNIVNFIPQMISQNYSQNPYQLKNKNQQKSQYEMHSNTNLNKQANKKGQTQNLQYPNLKFNNKAEQKGVNYPNLNLKDDYKFGLNIDQIFNKNERKVKQN